MAAMMNIMISIPTTKTTSFSYMVTKNRRSQCFKHVDGFALKSSPTDKNDVVLSTLSKDEISSGGVSYMLDSASDVVTSFYDGINSRDLSRVTDLIAEDCVYEDLVFPKPIVGRKDILEFFEKFIYTISQDLQFVIDDISGEDTSAIGVTWHLEWKGKPFPFSKGCSFYRLQVFNGKRKIVLISNLGQFCFASSVCIHDQKPTNYGRDIVEPAVKPGDFALVAIRGVTWLLQRFPQLADRF
ncbi:polyketide cyclase SnoaL-like domain-containing protein [Tanacetum coccineum]